MSNFIKMTGLAASGAMCRRDGGHRFQYQPWCFDPFTNESHSRYVPIQINHDRAFRLPSCSAVCWQRSPEGLSVEFGIDIDKPIGRAAFLAVRHGYLTQLSIGANILQAIESTDTIGQFLKVFSARIEELSLTDAAANPETFVSIVDHPVPHRKSLPINPSDRALLTSFLRDLGIYSEPTPATSKPARSAAIATAPGEKLAREPVVCLSHIRKAAISHPPKGAKPPKKTGDFVQDLHADWIFKHRFSEWQRLQKLIAQSPTKQIEIVY